MVLGSSSLLGVLNAPMLYPGHEAQGFAVLSKSCSLCKLRILRLKSWDFQEMAYRAERHTPRTHPRGTYRTIWFLT